MPDVIRDDLAFLDRIHYYIPGWEVPKMRKEFFTDHYGFVVDYLAEALRELRRHSFTEVIDQHFSMGEHLNARDVKAVRKSVSGLIKLVYPDGRVTKLELAELLALALEGRRRVKEQLKKIGAFEYHQTSFSYRDKETTEERYVGVPEEGGRALLSTDPLAPGSLYAASVNAEGKVGLYRIEVGVSPGTGKLKLAGGIESRMKESAQRAFAFLQGHKVPMGLASVFDNTDFHVEAIDLFGNQIPCEAGIALIVGICSAIKKSPAIAGLIVLGEPAQRLAGLNGCAGRAKVHAEFTSNEPAKLAERVLLDEFGIFVAAGGEFDDKFERRSRAEDELEGAGGDAADLVGDVVEVLQRQESLVHMAGEMRGFLGRHFEEERFGLHAKPAVAFRHLCAWLHDDASGLGFDEPGRDVGEHRAGTKKVCGLVV